MMRLAIGLSLCILFVLGNCAKDSSSSVTYGKTTEAELLNSEGSPSRVYNPESQPHSKVYVLSSGRYQVDDGLVTARLRDPAPHERSLSYWIEKWNREGMRWDVVEPSLFEHNQDNVQYRSLGSGEGILYHPSSRTVETVYHFRGDL